jgi:hypothetical protein
MVSCGVLDGGFLGVWIFQFLEKYFEWWIEGGEQQGFFPFGRRMTTPKRRSRGW